eukprot:5041087-Pleurochrysis_carterae.AAC.6
MHMPSELVLAPSRTGAVNLTHVYGCARTRGKYVFRGGRQTVWQRAHWQVVPSSEQCRRCVTEERRGEADREATRFGSVGVVGGGEEFQGGRQ